MLDSLIGQVFLLAVAVVSASGGIYATFASRKQGQASANKTDAEADAVSDATWIRRLDALSTDLGRLQTLSDERFERLVEIETMITDHVSWDFKVSRMLREQGIEVEDPPSLVYVRRKIKEAQESIVRDMGNGEDLDPKPAPPQ